MECSVKRSVGELLAGDVGDVFASVPHVVFVLLGATRGYVLSANRYCSSFGFLAGWALKFTPVCVFSFGSFVLGPVCIIFWSLLFFGPFNFNNKEMAKKKFISVYELILLDYKVCIR